ncbi:transposase [Streptomyces sp. NPDC046161]|uniref:transposase n=1 Tax=Streptomyces sp. NPDC046161 TaxID=3155132 RepID=UPI0033D078FE
MGGVISTDDPKWIEPFSGLSEVQFARLVALLRRRGGDVQRGRPWGLPLEDRVLVATNWRTNLTLRQIAPLFGVSKSAADRILDHLAPLPATSPARRPRKDTVYIVDGTLVPTRDRSIAASSKNYRYSTNLQVVIDANSHFVVAIGTPLPGSRNDCRAFAESRVDRACRGAPVIADGGYQGTGLLIAHRRQHGQTHLSPQQEAENAVHRRARARVEHALSRLKNWKILREDRAPVDQRPTLARSVNELNLEDARKRLVIHPTNRFTPQLRHSDSRPRSGSQRQRARQYA